MSLAVIILLAGLVDTGLPAPGCLPPFIFGRFQLQTGIHNLGQLATHTKALQFAAFHIQREFHKLFLLKDSILAFLHHWKRPKPQKLFGLVFSSCSHQVSKHTGTVIFAAALALASSGVLPV